MELRTLQYLTKIQDRDGVSLEAQLKCTCGNMEFEVFHTGKQTKGILAPFLVRKKKQLVVKAVCPCCQNTIIVYDSTVDGTHPKPSDFAMEFIPFLSNKVPKSFPILLKYNYLPENSKVGENYSNQFEDCFLSILDQNGKEKQALIEE